MEELAQAGTTSRTGIQDYHHHFCVGSACPAARRPPRLDAAPGHLLGKRAVDYRARLAL